MVSASESWLYKCTNQQICPLETKWSFIREQVLLPECDLVGEREAEVVGVESGSLGLSNPREELALGTEW